MVDPTTSRQTNGGGRQLPNTASTLPLIALLGPAAIGMAVGATGCSVMRLLPPLLLLVQAVISVQTELVAVPVTVAGARRHHLRHVQLGRAERRALVVVSDGGDNASLQAYAQILELARRSDAVIYAIGLLGTSPAQEEEDPRLLERLCSDTGGVAHFPKSHSEIAAVAASIARDLREQYTLGFTPAAVAGSRPFRKIEVTVDTVSPPAPGRRRYPGERPMPESPRAGTPAKASMLDSADGVARPDRAGAGGSRSARENRGLRGVDKEYARWRR